MQEEAVGNQIIDKLVMKKELSSQYGNEKWKVKMETQNGNQIWKLSQNLNMEGPMESNIEEKYLFLIKDFNGGGLESRSG